MKWKLVSRLDEWWMKPVSHISNCWTQVYPTRSIHNKFGFCPHHSWCFGLPCVALKLAVLCCPSGLMGKPGTPQGNLALGQTRVFCLLKWQSFSKSIWKWSRSYLTPQSSVSSCRWFVISSWFGPNRRRRCRRHASLLKTYNEGLL